MVVDALVEGEPGIKQFVNLVGVLDIITYLAFDDTRRMDESGNKKKTATRVRERVYEARPRV